MPFFLNLFHSLWETAHKTEGLSTVKACAQAKRNIDANALAYISVNNNELSSLSTDEFLRVATSENIETYILRSPNIALINGEFMKTWIAQLAECLFDKGIELTLPALRRPICKELFTDKNRRLLLSYLVLGVTRKWKQEECRNTVLKGSNLLNKLNEHCSFEELAAAFFLINEEYQLIGKAGCEALILTPIYFRFKYREHVRKLANLYPEYGEELLKNIVSNT